MLYVFLMGVGLSVLGIFSFTGIESFLLNNGFSWTFAKAFPYALLVAGGALMFLSRLLNISFLSFLIPKIKWVRRLVLAGYLFAPFAIGFALHPIYQGDFSNAGRALTDQEQLKEFKKADLVVLAIPGCPYCMQSVSDLKKMKARTPDLRILFVVCSSTKSDLQPYQELAENVFPVVNAKQVEAAVSAAQGSFPTFVLCEGKKGSMAWSNNDFGVGAKDYIEAALR